MHLFISQKPKNLSNIILIILFTQLVSCDLFLAPYKSLGKGKKGKQTQESKTFNLMTMTKGRMSLPNGKKIETYLAVTTAEQTQGLSGLKPFHFSKDDSMLFAYSSDDYRRFWMLDTYFDLDIYFLDKNLKIIKAQKSLKHHKGKENQSSVARTATIFCRHVLEMRADSPLSQSMKEGDLLKWISSPSLSQTLSNIRQKK